MNYADDLRRALNLIEGAIEGMTREGISLYALEATRRAHDELSATIEELPTDIVAGENEHCLGCMYHLHTVDMEPYGDRMVPRDSYECTVADPLKCPAVNAVGFQDPDRPETCIPKWLRRQAQ